MDVARLFTPSSDVTEETVRRIVRKIFASHKTHDDEFFGSATMAVCIPTGTTIGFIVRKLDSIGFTVNDIQYNPNYEQEVYFKLIWNSDLNHYSKIWHVT